MASALVSSNSLSALRDILLPAVHTAHSRASSDVVNAGLEVDYVTDRILFGVQYEFMDRRELESGDYKRLAWPRLQQALRLDVDAGKLERAERRRMLVRAQAARAAKPVPVRKA